MSTVFDFDSIIEDYDCGMAVEPTRMDAASTMRAPDAAEAWSVEDDSPSVTIAAVSPSRRPLSRPLRALLWSVLVAAFVAIGFVIGAQFPVREVASQPVVTTVTKTVPAPNHERATLLADLHSRGTIIDSSQAKDRVAKASLDVCPYLKDHDVFQAADWMNERLAPMVSHWNRDDSAVLVMSSVLTYCPGVATQEMPKLGLNIPGQHTVGN